jgi:hypothetical protein
MRQAVHQRSLRDVSTQLAIPRGSRMLGGMSTHQRARGPAVVAALLGGLVAAGAGAGAGCGTGLGGGDDDGDRGDGGLDAPGRACTPTIGDLARPLEVRPVYVDRHDQPRPIVDDGPVELYSPPQGGQVLLVGLEARNVLGCEASITGSLRDPATGAELGGEGRPTQLVEGADGWGRLAFPPIAVTANVTACPLNDLTRDVDGNPWRLDLALSDERGMTATWTGTVTPFCDPSGPDAESCRCQCDADFVFGEPCPVDP